MIRAGCTYSLRTANATLRVALRTDASAGSFAFFHKISPHSLLLVVYCESFIKVTLIRAKAFAKDKGSMGAQADMRRRSDLLSSFLTETHESFQENNAERTFVREHCCLESFRRRTGCSPSRWRSRQCEHRKTLPSFSGATLQPARISGAQYFVLLCLRRFPCRRYGRYSRFRHCSGRKRRI